MTDPPTGLRSQPPVDRRFFWRVVGASVFFLMLGLLAMWIYFATREQPSVGFEENVNPSPPLLGGNPTAPPNRIRLFFTQDGVQLTPEMRDITAPASPHERAQLVIKALLEGPRTGALRSPIPRTATLRALYVANDALILDFSPELRNDLHPDVASEVLCVYGLVNTMLLNCPGLKSVTLLIDGKPVETLRGSVDLSLPLVQNVALVATERRRG
jgi:hypothetical protein